ncbi:ferric reductase transmembrane component 7 [Coniella lustricola]|uniref:ferric-chelate reductase (NADPH) n=1 Tax=Coniella lustricola TaxID=2025994 RepID=A0A2T2ZSZ2_9PEZI|nr:ferric reductase transmembrane component 7 [Coniella lustricola]
MVAQGQRGCGLTIRGMAEAMSQRTEELAKRIYIPLTATSPPGLVQADTVDPWLKSGKYGLAWTYFALVLLVAVIIVRLWHYWQDKIRQAIYKQEVEQYYNNLWAADAQHAQDASHTGGQGTPGRHFFPEEEKAATAFRPDAHFSSIGLINDTLALFRWVFYRPIPDLRWRKHRITFSSSAVLAVGFIGLAFVALYCFLPQPLYWVKIIYGSPPLAIRAGMICVALTPWIVATAVKANILSLVTGIAPDRLNVFHRWAGYLCLFMALVHMIPFFIQPVWEDGGMAVFSKLFPPGSGIIYGSGIAAFVPLCWLCVASLPVVRRHVYELFALLHAPVGYVYIGVLFWHTKNYLLSWSYLYASIAILFICNVWRLTKLNWTKPWRYAFMVGDEAAIQIMTENTIKITIPTQMKWAPGQYVYLRMPGISLLENHPFTISSLCSEDFPSEYGEQYRDCVLVFRPYGGFTKKVLETAIEKGPFHTYRAFLDGPYGGMRRELAAFDTCILIAGGSGITSLMSQLLNLIKRMRDGKAITKKIVVVWSLKRLEAMDWFREELRICREAAPPESVTCKFFVTAAVRHSQQVASAAAAGGASARVPRPLSNAFHDKLDGFVAGIASKRNSTLIADVAQGDPEQERELRAEEQDRFTALPQQKYLQPHNVVPPPPANPPNKNRQSYTDEALSRLEGHDGGTDTKQQQQPVADALAEEKGKKREFHFRPLQTKTEAPLHFNYPPPNSPAHKRSSMHLATGQQVHESDNDGSAGHQHQQGPSMDGGGGGGGGPDVPELAHLRTNVGGGVHGRNTAAGARPTSTFGPPSGFEFGFPETPTEFQKNLMRFAFPVPHQIDGGWSVEYGRPDLGYMLREWATGGSDGRGILGRRTAVFVCGPPAMRVGVANTVARLQAEIWGDPMLEEIYLHAENYAL